MSEYTLPSGCASIETEGGIMSEINYRYPVSGKDKTIQELLQECLNLQARIAELEDKVSVQSYFLKQYHEAEDIADKRIAELEAETAELIEEIEADRSIKADKDKRIAEYQQECKRLCFEVGFEKRRGDIADKRIAELEDKLKAIQENDDARRRTRTKQEAMAVREPHGARTGCDPRG